MRVAVGIICCILMLAVCNGTVCAVDAKRVVAVASFANLNKDPAQDWLSTGIGETLTVKLGQVPSLTLVERLRLSDAMKELSLQDTALVDASTATKIGKIVGAQTMVLGAIQRSGDELRITARFVDVESGAISNSAQADGTMKEVFSIQDRLADALLASLGVQVSTEVNQKIKAKPTEDIAAYEAYSKGVSSMQSGNYEEAADELKQATDKDPNFKLAQDTFRFVKWVRPNARSSVFAARLSEPYDKVYQTMLSAVKTGGVCKLHKEDKSIGKIEAKTGMNWRSGGQDIEINVESIGGVTGINIVSQTRRSYFGIRQKIDWGESRKSIRRLLRVFYEEMDLTHVSP